MRESYANLVLSALNGFVLANSGVLELVADTSAVRLKHYSKEHPALVFGGCMGMEPTLSAMSQGRLADAVVFGNKRSPPDPYTIMRTALSVNAGNGVLLICGKEEEEKEAFICATGLLEEANIECKLLTVDDDIAARGFCRSTTAGKLQVTAITKAALEGGASLKDAYRIARKARNFTKSISVGANPPNSEKGLDSILESLEDIEYGMGENGGPGTKYAVSPSIMQTVDHVLFLLKNSMSIYNSDTICTLLSGFGDISLMNMFIFNDKLNNSLKNQNIHVQGMKINPTPQKSSGKGITVSFMLLDDELKKYYDTI